MNCYFVKATIDNGRVSPHTHLFTLIVDEEWADSLVLGWATDRVEDLIQHRHPQYGAEYTLEMYIPTEQEIQNLISTREKNISRINSEIEALKGLFV